jgi:hypothetical protein
MKMQLGILLLGLAALPAYAVNFSGKWALQSGGGGRGGPTIITLNHVGNEVTGSISGRGGSGGSGAPVNTEVLGGKVEGDVLTFYVWTGNDQPAKTTYKGTMAPSGDEIQFTITGGRGGGGGMGGGGQGGGQGAGRGGAGGQGSVAAPAGASAQGGQSPAAAAAGRGQASGPQQVIAKRAK